MAVRKIFTVASGSTTVPMSRPSISTSCFLAISRCSSSRKARTVGFAPTAEAAIPAASVRMAVLTSSSFK